MFLLLAYNQSLQIYRVGRKKRATFIFTLHCEYMRYTSICLMFWTLTVRVLVVFHTSHSVQSRLGLLPIFPLPHFHPLQDRSDISTPAISTPTGPCWYFHSCNFHPYRTVPMFPLLHFHLLHFLDVSCRYFHSCIFHSRIFSAPK